jgi:hypothetical protein
MKMPGGKSEAKKKLLGRHEHNWEDNIKTDVSELGYDGVDWC